MVGLKPTPNYPLTMSQQLLRQLFSQHGTWEKVGRLLGIHRETCRRHYFWVNPSAPLISCALATLFPEHAHELMAKYVCSHCGNPIPIARIQESPSTTRCSRACDVAARKENARKRYVPAEPINKGTYGRDVTMPDWLHDDFIAYDPEEVCA